MFLSPPPGRLVFVCALVSAFLIRAAAAPSWPPTTDIASDPAVLSGQLDNGLRYAIRANTEPRGRVSLRLLVRAGSLDETDDERGLAHYLEHMAFNGTRRFPADTLVDYFQRQGMAFGADTNANTGFERTVYRLELPASDAAALDEGLKVLGDFASGILVEPAQVDKERGVILAEKRSRDSVEFRTALAEYEFLLPGTRPPRRFPIGVTETLEAADAERIRNFYLRLYQPGNMAVVVVGDIAPALVEERLRAAFGDLIGDAALPARPPHGKLAPTQVPAAGVHRESEASTATVSVTIVTPYLKLPDSARARTRNVPRDAAFAIVGRRLERLSRKDGATFVNASARSDTVLDFAGVSSVELTGAPEHWAANLALADAEIRRALQFGFSPAEVKEVVDSVLNELEEAVRAAPTRRSPALANAIMAAIHDDEVFTTPETQLAIARPAIEALTPAACLDALRAAWEKGAPRLFVHGRIEPSVTEDEVLRVFTAGHAVALDRPDDLPVEKFEYTDFGPAGAVASRTDIADLGITLVTFANGVRLNLKRTDFQANSIGLRARLGGGTLEVPPDRVELAAIANALVNQGGLGKYDIDTLKRILAGRTVNVGFGVTEDAFGFGGSSSPKDLEVALQLLCATITDPGLRPDVLGRVRRSLTQTYERMLRLPSGIAALKVQPLLASGDPRFGFPPLERLLAVTAADVPTWLTPIFARGALEVAIVGDIDIDTTIALAARTLGALPTREARPDFAEARRVRFPEKVPVEEFLVDSTLPKALVQVYWPSDDASDIARTRRMGLLAAIARDRLRKVIREELGAAYSPAATNTPSETYPGYGLFSISVEVDPLKTATVEAVVLHIVEELKGGGVTEDELERAREPALTQIRESQRQNSYWLGTVLARAQEKPESLEHARTRLTDFQSITKAELDALAARIFDNNRAARFVIRPGTEGAAK